MPRDLLRRYRPVLRPVAAFLVFLLVVSALLQGLGRVGMWLLDDLEGSANAWLDGRARLEGLAGGWDGLNPVASARHIELPAGRVERVTLELDVLESVRRNRLVLERLLVGAADLAVERTRDGWRLAGMEAAASEFDLLRLLDDIDEVRIDGRLAIAGAEEPEDRLVVAVRGVNRDGAHAYDVSIRNPECTAPCRLDAHWRAQDPTWAGRPQERFLELSGGFALPAPFVDWLGLHAGLQVSVDGRWLERRDRGGGAFDVRLQRVGLPGGIVGSLSTGLRGAFRDGRREGRLEDLNLAAGDAELQLDPVQFRTRPHGTEFWVRTLSLGELSSFLTVALDGVDVARRWLGGVRPDGKLFNVHALVGPEGIGYAATFDELQLDPHRGIPWVRNAVGKFIGHERGARLTLNSETMRVGITDVFTDRWRWENAQGNLHAWFGDGYLGMQAPYFRLESGGSRLSGSFSLARPDNRMDQRVAMLVDIDRLDVVEARTYIPYRLSDALRTWLHDGPRGGRLIGPKLAYQGQVHTLPDDRSRRLEVQARLSGGKVRYHPDWPMVTDAEGFVTVAGSETFASVEFARTLSAEFQDGSVRVGDGGAYAAVSLRGEVETGVALDFVRGSPLAEWMTFVTPEWDGTGRLELNGDLYVPIDASHDRGLDARLRFDLADVGLTLPEYRLEVAHLNGPVRYAYPYGLSAEPLAAELFGRPAAIAAQSDDDAIDLRFQGTAATSDVYRLIDADDFGLATGEAPFDATLTIAVDGRVPTMSVTSDLVGFDIDLPGLFAKAAPRAIPAGIDLEFLEEFVVVRLRTDGLNGWLHVEDVPSRGAFGVRSAAPPVAIDADEVAISGRIDALDVGAWLSGTGETELPVPWRLADVHIDRLQVETQVFEDVVIAGSSRGDSMALQFTSNDLEGRLLSTGDEPMDFEFATIRLPEPDGEGDPLDASIIDLLPDADVSIDSLTVGDEDFGTWSFHLRQRPQGLLVGRLHADLKGTEIAAPEGVFWHAADDRSGGAIRLTMKDLAEVLPQWDFAPSLEAEWAELQVDASWPGSPLNVEFNGLRGDVSFNARNGSFVEVSGGGALRIMALLNINTFFRRMSLNFKDVTAKGTSFDTIEAATRFDDGSLTFVEPAKVKGSGSDFKLGGSVNLIDGIMNDNEMIVTLPVSDSLPWYAVYISLANPVAAAAVLAGQQVLKKQIKQMSSAKYRISGPWEDPEVKLVGIWNDEVQAFDDLAQESKAPGLPSDAQNRSQTEGGS